MTFSQQIKNLFNILVPTQITPQQKNTLQIIAATTLACAAFFTLHYYHARRAPAILRIQQLRQCISQGLQRAELSREELLLEQSHLIEEEELAMKLILVSKLKQKERDKLQFVRNPLFPPFEQGLFIKELGPYHRLLFNKFNLYKEHLLVVTKEFQPQASPLNREDFKQTILATQAVRGLYFYNSGPKAGASQNHKHIQVFPHEARDLPIFRSILEYSRQLKHEIQQNPDKNNPEQLQIIEYPHFNFKHGFILIGKTLQNQSEMDKASQKHTSKEDNMLKLRQNTFRAYQKLYLTLIGKLDQELQGKTEYNLIGCQHFLLLIPRKKQKAFNDVSVNAVGFMGSLLLKEKKVLARYLLERRLGSKILEDITFSKKHK